MISTKSKQEGMTPDPIRNEMFEGGVVLSPVPLHLLMEAMKESIRQEVRAELAELKANEENKFVTHEAAARKLGVSSPTLRKWRKEGKVPFKVIGNSIKYGSKDLESLLKSQPKKQRS